MKALDRLRFLALGAPLFPPFPLLSPKAPPETEKGDKSDKSGPVLVESLRPRAPPVTCLGCVHADPGPASTAPPTGQCKVSLLWQHLDQPRACADHQEAELQNLRDLYEERAGILEHDAGLSREDAEAAAMTELARHPRPLRWLAKSPCGPSTP